MFIEAIGPWNDEFFGELHKKLSEAAQQLNSPNYGVLLSPMGDAVTSPKNAYMHSLFVKNAQAKAVAVNFEHCSSAFISKAMFKGIYTRAELPYQFFDDKVSAKAWLDSVLSCN